MNIKTVLPGEVKGSRGAGTRKVYPGEIAGRKNPRKGE